MSLKLTKFSVVLALFFSFLFVLTACEPNNVSRGNLYSSYDIVIEVVHSDTEEGISSAALTLEDDDGNIQTAVPAERTGIYEFENIELLDGGEYDININRTGYEEEIITILAEDSEIIRTGGDAAKLTEADNADNELIDEQGGELQLSDGTTLEISEGAVDKSTELTIESVEDNGDSGIYETRQYAIFSNIESFNKKVKFIYPLPDNAPSEPERYQINLVNEDTGTVLPQEDENSHWKINTGENKLIYTTDSFFLPENDIENSGGIQVQKREFFRSILRIDYNPEQPVDKVKITGIPYSCQANTDYCWAAAYQMLTEAYMNRESAAAIWHIISRFGIDDDNPGLWGSLSKVEARFFPATVNLFKDRTGTAPERRWWRRPGDSFVEYLKDQLSNKKPVFLHTGKHAVVLVGYDASGSEIKFYVQNPNGINSPVELKTTGEMGLGDDMVTVVPAESINNRRSQIGLDVWDNSLMFIGGEVMKFMWDHDKSEGYRIVNNEGEEKLISSELKYLDLGGSIVKVANTSGETKELILNIEIEPVNYKQEKFSRDVGPFVIEDNKYTEMPGLIEDNDELKVFTEEFVVPSENSEEYRLTLSLKEDGKIINRRKIEFTLAPYAYEENSPPSKPKLISPADGATGVSISPVGEWEESVDPDGDKVVYDIYGKEEHSSFEKVVSGLEDTSYEATDFTLEYNTVYYWKVVARDGKGGATASDIRTFTTESGDSANIIEFEDSNLEGVIRDLINKPEDPIYKSDVEEIKGSCSDFRNKGISSLTGMQYLVNLEGIVLDDNQITDLSPLKDLTSLQDLFMRNNNVNMVTPLQGLKNLRELDLYNNNVEDISALANLTNLESLILGRNNISEITKLQNMKKLKILRLGENNIESILSLQELTNLTELRLYFNNIADITPLAGLTHLKELTLDHNSIQDISVLGNLTQLEKLRLGNNSIVDVGSLANLNNLTFLRLENNNISNITPLQDMTGLTELWLYGNEIQDISALQGLINLEKLDLINNTLKDISPLQNLTGLSELNLFNNSIEDITPLVENEGLGPGDEIDLRYNLLDLSSGSSDMQAINELESRGVDVKYEPQAAG